MMKTRSLISGLLVCGATLALVCNLSAQTTNRTAKVVRVQGTARYTLNNGTDWNDLGVGTVLKDGALIQTDRKDGTFVDVVFGEGNGAGLVALAGALGKPAAKGGGGHQHPANVDVVRLWKDTALGLDKLSETPTGAGIQTETQLDLRKGHITGNVKKMVAGSTYEIKYPKGVAGIRGSVYDMNLIEGIDNGTVTVTCILDMLTGSAVLSFTPVGSTTPITQTILPDFGYNTGTQTLAPLTAEQIAYLSDVLSSMGVTTEVQITILTGNQGVIQQVTTTVGVRSTVTTQTGGTGSQTGGSGGSVTTTVTPPPPVSSN